MKEFGVPPQMVGAFQTMSLPEVMYYLYLPVVMPAESQLRLPANVERCRAMICAAADWARAHGRDTEQDYIYLSARKGWATRDNPLNRPGWHADGFGTDDLNFVWWSGAGTRFAIGNFGNVPDDHAESLLHFERIAQTSGRVQIIDTLPARNLYALNPWVVHATPLIDQGQMRQYVKVSLSRHRYNLENNSHNYLFEYDWPMFGREDGRNDTGKDYA